MPPLPRRFLRISSTLAASICLLPLLAVSCDEKADETPAKTAKSSEDGGKSAKTDKNSEAEKSDEEEAPQAPARVELTPEAAKKLLTVDAANLEMGETAVNDLRLSKLSCAGVTRPLMGGMAIIGALAERKEALDACAPAGDAAIATWKSEGAGLDGLEVAGAGSAKADACIKAALAEAKSPFAATCAAVVLVGESAGADAAAKKFLGP